MKKLPLLSTLLLMLFISACSAIPLKTMYHLATTDLMTVDPAYLSAATRVPSGLRESKKGVKMTFSSWLGEKKKNAKVLEIKLEKVTDKEKLLSIKALEKTSYTTLLYRISAKDVERIKAFRQQHKKRKQAYGDNMQGSFTIGVSYCRAGKLSDKPILVSTWLKVGKDTGLLPLIIDHDMQEDLKKNDKSIDKILPLCNKEDLKKIGSASIGIKYKS